MYSSSDPTQCEAMALILRGAAEQVLLDAKVDIVIQAHLHNYEVMRVLCVAIHVFTVRYHVVCQLFYEFQVFWPMANGVVTQFNYNQPKVERERVIRIQKRSHDCLFRS